MGIGYVGIFAYNNGLQSVIGVRESLISIDAANRSTSTRKSPSRQPNHCYGRQLLHHVITHVPLKPGHWAKPLQTFTSCPVTAPQSWD